MKAIWLCSWFPNEKDLFRGDFIQRQAIATSLFLKIDVIHIVFCDEEKSEIRIVNSQLTEHIFYLPKKNKLLDEWNFFKTHQFFLKKFKEKNGMPDIIHAQIPLPSGRIALYWKYRFQIPYILTEHYGIYNKQVLDHFQTRSFLFRFFTKKIIQNASSFLPVSKSLGEDVNQVVTKIEYTDIPNVVDTNLFHYEKKISNLLFQFIHISDMSENKNVLGILKAVQLFSMTEKHFQILFIGAKKQEIEKKARELGIAEYCLFMDSIPYDEVAKIVRNANVGILFSHSESQSCVVLEWLCSGLPVISSAVGGVRELINETNGILIPSNNHQALADAMKKIMINYATLNQQQISESAIRKYSYESVGKSIFEVYQKVWMSKK